MFPNLQGVDLAFYGDSVLELFNSDSGGLTNVFVDVFSEYTALVQAIGGATLCSKFAIRYFSTKFALFVHLHAVLHSRLAKSDPVFPSSASKIAPIESDKLL